MTTPALPMVGLAEGPSARALPATNANTSAPFAELLGIAPALDAATSPAILELTSTLAGDGAAAPDEPESDDYSPEGWLALLALAVAATTAGQTSDSDGSATESGDHHQAGGSPVGKVAVAGEASSAATLESIGLGRAADRDSARTDLAPAKEAATQANAAFATAVSQSLAADAAAAVAVEATREALDSWQSMNSTSHTTRPASAHAVLQLSQPVGTPSWQHELATRVTWLVRGAEQGATLNLSPADLGPVEVRISVREGEATVSFTAAHADTRAALDAALPRLRDMFASQGLLLTEGSVSAPPSGNSGDAAQEQARRAQADLRRALRSDGDASTVATTRITQHSLLDLYA